MTAPQEYATIEIGDLTEEELDEFRALAIRIVERRRVPRNQDKGDFEAGWQAGRCGAGAQAVDTNWGGGPYIGRAREVWIAAYGYGDIAKNASPSSTPEADWEIWLQDAPPPGHPGWAFEVGDTLHYQSPPSAPYWWRVDSLGDDPQKNFGFIGLQCTESENGPDIPGGMIVKPGNLRRDSDAPKAPPQGTTLGATGFLRHPVAASRAGQGSQVEPRYERHHLACVLGHPDHQCGWCGQGRRSQL